MTTPTGSQPTPVQIHHCLNAMYDADGRTPFILSLDGAGVYGLTTAIWLRQLCEQVDGFMVPGQVRWFAGCSSGAINSLLLAMHASPREAVLSGELERFWTGTDVFANRNPLTRWLSAAGLSAMFGTAEFLGALEDEFGDTKLGEVRNRVLVSTYNWTGASVKEQHFRTPFEGPTPDLEAFRPANMFRLGKRPAVGKPGAGQTLTHWQPKFFDSHGMTSGDKDIRLTDVAYAAACVPGLRALRGGLGDGASFNANPSVGAIAHILDEWEQCVEYGLHLTAVPNIPGARLSPREQIRRIMTDGLKFNTPRSIDDWEQLPDDQKIQDVQLNDADWVRTHGKGVLLGWMRILSVGSGQALPALAYSNLDVGTNLWQALPTHPFDGTLLPSGFFAIDAPATAAEYACLKLLDETRHLRLNPDLMSIPTVLASILAINPTMRSGLTRMIRERTDGQISRRAVARTAEFLKVHCAFGTSWYGSEARKGFAEQIGAWQQERAARATTRLEAAPWNLPSS